MAAFDTTPRSASGASFFGVFISAFAAISAWNDRRLTRKALSQLSARELRDIGLERGDIYNM